MRVATLGIVLEGNMVLLGEKKKGEIGIGRVCGPGGKLEPDETLGECLVRETSEEFGLTIEPIDTMDPVAFIIFYKGLTKFSSLNRILNFFHLGGVPDFAVFVYQCQLVPGQIVTETDEMILHWYPLNDLPFDQMYEADRHWFPKAANGERFYAKVYYLGRAKKFDFIRFFPFT